MIHFHKYLVAKNKNRLFFASLIIVFISLESCSSSTSPEIKFLTPEDIDLVIEICKIKTENNIHAIPPKRFPIHTKEDSSWVLTEAKAWTSGFFPGILWLYYSQNESEEILSYAQQWTSNLESQKFNTDSHDIGFIMMNSFGNKFKFQPSETDKEILLKSASSLASRYNPKVGAIQSWNGSYKVIIDNMINLELLFWASRNGGGIEYYDIAKRHAETTLREHIRDDWGTYHVVVFDTTNGEAINKMTHQGYADWSSWARGQAWGIYGFTIAFRETGDEAFLDAAIHLSEYYWDHLPNDKVPYWDLNLPDTERRKFKDSSASAIILRAFLELRNFVPYTKEYDKKIRILVSSLVAQYFSFDSNYPGFLLHGAYHINSDVPNRWDTSTIWGDYYFLESLLMLRNTDILH